MLINAGIGDIQSYELRGNDNTVRSYCSLGRVTENPGSIPGPVNGRSSLYLVVLQVIRGRIAGAGGSMPDGDTRYVAVLPQVERQPLVGSSIAGPLSGNNSVIRKIAGLGRNVIAAGLITYC